jgi:hypothetical protein
MVTYYLYEVPGEKNGATKDWKARRRYNFNRYQVEPILIETMEGPDTEDMWQVVGDREWELADLNGYKRGEHYLAIRIKSNHNNRVNGFPLNAPSLGGLAGAGRENGKKMRTANKEQAEEVRAKYSTGNYTYRSLANESGISRGTISRILNNPNYEA